MLQISLNFLFLLVCLNIIPAPFNPLLLSEEARHQNSLDGSALNNIINQEMPDHVENNSLIINCLIKINNIIRGETTVRIEQNKENDIAWVNLTPIRDLIKKDTEEDFYESFSKELINKEKFIKPFKLENGFCIEFNFDDQIVEVSIPPSFIKLQISSIYGATFSQITVQICLTL